MNGIAVLHEAVREYVYPVRRNRLCIKLKCTREAGLSWEIVYWNRFLDGERKCLKLAPFSRDDGFDCFTCEIVSEEGVKYLRYYFTAAGGDGTLYAAADGVSRDKPGKPFEYLYTNECDVFEVPEWAAGAVLYQIFPERFYNGDKANDPLPAADWNGTPTRESFFGGDLKGILQKLDYIAELNVDMIYLNPIFVSPSNHKYDTEDYFKVDPSLGTLEDLRRLVAACHARNIRVLLDGVFNHCGCTFGPFRDVLQNGEASIYRDWFFIEGFPVRTDPPNYECVGYYNRMPKLRLKNRETRNYFLDVGTYWIREADIDGWRLDVADEVDFTFWQEFRRTVKGVKSDALLVGETWKDGRDLLRGDQMDSVMNYLFYDAVTGFFAEKKLDALGFDHRIQKMLSAYPKMATPLLFNLIGSHDTARFLSLSGNDKRRLKMAAAFQMTFPGMPAVYYGDETGMDGGNDPGCRGAIDWENMDRELLLYYKTLIGIRKSTPSLKYGDFACILCGDGIYGYARRCESETTYVVINNSADEKEITVPAFERSNTELYSLFGGERAGLMELCGGERFYQDDMHPYESKFKMILPAYHVEIMNTGRL
jgi:cyclomaltodextrinase